MQRGCYGHTEGVQTQGGQPGVDQEDQVQAQQGQREIDEDLRGVVSTQLPETGMEMNVRKMKGKTKTEKNLSCD